jgi:ketosteroid isomerase-like protein
MTRREILAATAIAAIGTRSAHAHTGAGKVADDLADLTLRANSALMNGDARLFSQTLPHSADYTLMQPFGGEVVRGFDVSAAHLDQLGGFFRNGTYRQEIVQTIESDDVAVLVTLEHQEVEVGGLPRQDWPLRVTLVFRREEAGWRIVHRHADPLLPGIAVPHAAAIARGEFSSMAR